MSSLQKNDSNWGWISPQLFQQFEQENTTAHRIYSTPTCWIERLNNTLLISYSHTSEISPLLNEISTRSRSFHFEAHRIYKKHLVKKSSQQSPPTLISGSSPQQKMETVFEKGTPYLVDLSAGYSFGLFIDQRQNRDFLRRFLVENNFSNKTPQVLNCFCYTASFSIVAAKAGAHTTNVDLSKKTLTWAKDNFKENQLDLSSHQFIADDVRKVVPRLAKRGQCYDAIIIDPPTFSRSKQGGPFRIEDAVPSLLKMAQACSHSQTALLFSTNCKTLKKTNLVKIMKTELNTWRRGKWLSVPAPQDIPSPAMPSTVWALPEE